MEWDSLKALQPHGVLLLSRKVKVDKQESPWLTVAQTGSVTGSGVVGGAEGACWGLASPGPLLHLCSSRLRSLRFGSRTPSTKPRAWPAIAAPLAGKWMCPQPDSPPGHSAPPLEGHSLRVPEIRPFYLPPSGQHFLWSTCRLSRGCEGVGVFAQIKPVPVDSLGSHLEE